MDRRLLALTLVLALANVCPALAGVTPELQRQIRSSTFEVVLKKPAEGAVAYEKPLPLEMLPYIERTDQYRSIGTAFTLGNNTFVTAAHVLLAAVDSQYGAPALRSADGTVHSISSINRFSASEDFVVFSLSDAPTTSLPTNRSPHIDDPVLAVGNALGEGIVIRDGLFTSETPEDQDGRWKWIRFSAAASPGNSGGPLLDTAGNVIGVVIAKSPNENLNYALPIANVLDSAPSKARFDQRILTKLPFAQASQPYSLKEEFALPLSWEKFVSAYQALAERHSDKARAALLSANAASMFPRGEGTEAILFGSSSTGRELGIIAQEADGSWAVQEPDFRFADLPGDGRVGVASAASATLLALHRGSEASDDRFYADSKAFMDIALKVLNVNRAVGTDRVKVISLGPAVSDVTTQDSYGRKWQVRVWPLPFLDLYLVAQLLPTPDGYAGLLEYVPSAGLREGKVELSMLANQVSASYVGTAAQWRSFLARAPLLPQALRDVTLDSSSGWKLHTHRFEIAVPPSLIKLDSHSEILMTMSYAYEGPKVVWDIGGVWWYRDAQEKVYLGLWRRPRPPATARLEMRSRFSDLLEHHSPYDGLPVRASSDAVDVSMGIQAPGSKESMASSDLAYGLTLRMDGNPTPPQIELYETSALGGVRILEHGAGADIPASGSPTVANEVDQSLKTLAAGMKFMDGVGKDIRGRLPSDDAQEFIVEPMRTAFARISRGSDSSAQPSQADLYSSLRDRSQDLEAYWRIAPSVVSNRDLWRPFLAHNQLPENTPHEPSVLQAETSLNELVGKGGPPTAEWAKRSRILGQAYIDERSRMARKAALGTAVGVYRPRKSACPEPATRTSGTAKPKPGNFTALEEFYPVALKHKGVEGVVVVSAKINSAGCETQAAIVASSGSDEFDEAALQWTDTATFLPAEMNGAAVDGTLQFAVQFQLR